VERLVARLRRAGGEPESESEAGTAEGSRFVPSPLDRSVRRAHGGGGDEAARELGRIDERAREMEDRRRDR
jgi:hypothetical protein